jgi:hypothetical protein
MNFADKYPTYMTHETARELLEQSQERRAKHMKQRAVAAAKAIQLAQQPEDRRLGERRVVGTAPRFATMQDALNFRERRVGDRRFSTAPMPFDALALA